MPNNILAATSAQTLSLSSPSREWNAPYIGSRREARGPDSWAPSKKKRPQHHPPQPQLEPHSHANGATQAGLYSRAGSNDQRHIAEGRPGGCPGSRKESNAGRPPQQQPQPQQTKYWAPRTHKESNTHRPPGPSEQRPPDAIIAKGRRGDCSGSPTGAPTKDETSRRGAGTWA